MKITFFAILLAAFFMGAMSVQAEDWTTIDGKVYPQVNVLKVEPDAVTILYRDGGALIPLIKLPDNLQKKFHYDPDTAKAAADARDQADLENARALRAESEQILAQKQAEQEAQNSCDDSGGGYSYSQSSSADSTHHSEGGIADITHRLRDDVVYDSTHYSVASAVPRGPISLPPPDAKHYSIDDIVYSGN
jgi:hypothetical protein